MSFTREETGRMNLIFDAIYRERERQELLKAQGKFTFTCSDIALRDDNRACILVEEVGEVCRAVLSLYGMTKDTPEKASIPHLRKELVQVAAVAVAWIEGLDKQTDVTEGLQQ